MSENTVNEQLARVLAIAQNRQLTTEEVKSILKCGKTTKEQPPSAPVASTSKFAHKNKYDVLSDLSDSEMEFTEDDSTQKKQMKRTSTQDEEQPKKRKLVEDESKNAERSSKDKKLPTIIIKSEIPHHIFKLIKLNMKSQIIIKYIGRSIYHINTFNKEDNDYLKNFLRSRNYNFYTHADKGEAYKKIVLRGIDPAVTEQEIKDDLISKDIKIHKIIQMSKKTDNQSTYYLPIYIVILKPDQELKKVREIKYILSYVVKWEKLNATNRVLQCFKCQHFGHSSKYCDMAYRCVKCTYNHEPGKCTKIKGQDAPECVNCGQAHPANYRNCPTLLAAQQKQQDMKLKQNRYVPAPLPPNQTKKYSDLLRSSSNTKTKQIEDDPSCSIQHIQELFSKWNISKIIDNLKIYLPKLINARNFFEIITIGMEFINKTFTNDY